jgi:hypothetical protein
MKKKSKLIVAALVASIAALLLVFNKGLDKIKDFDLRDIFDTEDEDD